MKCQNCGREFTGRFCTRCGTENPDFINPYANNMNTPPRAPYPQTPPVPPVNCVQAPQGYYNYYPAPSKKSSAGKVVLIIFAVIGILAILWVGIIAVGFGLMSLVDCSTCDTDYYASYNIDVDKNKVLKEYDGKKAPKGYEYISATIQLQTDTYNEADLCSFTVNCYADGKACKELTGLNDDLQSAIVPENETVSYEAVFQVPKDSNAVTVFVYDCNDTSLKSFSLN